MKAALPLLILLACSGCNGQSSGGGTSEGDPVTDSAAVTVALTLKHAEHSDDSNTTTRTFTVRGETARLTERTSGAHASEPVDVSQALTAAQRDELRALIEGSGLLDAKSLTGDLDPGESDYFYVVTTAELELTVGERRNAVTLKGITSLVKVDPPFASEPSYLAVERLAAKIAQLARGG